MRGIFKQKISPTELINVMKYCIEMRESTKSLHFPTFNLSHTQMSSATRACTQLEGARGQSTSCPHCPRQCAGHSSIAQLSEDSALWGHAKVSRLPWCYQPALPATAGLASFRTRFKFPCGLRPCSTLTETLLYTEFQEFGCHLLIFNNCPKILSIYLFYCKNKLKRVSYTG